jgi:hypothetical protein
MAGALRNHYIVWSVESISQAGNVIILRIGFRTFTPHSKPLSEAMNVRAAGTFSSPNPAEHPQQDPK